MIKALETLDAVEIGSQEYYIDAKHDCVINCDTHESKPFSKLQLAGLLVSQKVISMELS